MIKFHWAVWAFLIFLFNVLSDRSASANSPWSWNFLTTCVAYSLNGAATGMTTICLGDSQNGLQGVSGDPHERQRK